ncbi:alpha/beta fold hydrolase [Hymenobacter chitinivorans]|uniref:Pimeloyl-ACP methyl ester carboxylesterase n=1 Tax=Hymenobacter chitinivorans DSM 11115 TaxID=1121954 RepID=A0A2M9BRJ0_9BACT|nr:alpha/beta hydrolase [Hymenobacter chitinivorans]PJJ60561.1 pimeloyl-ACP methyl ester carboxylesterase [Hymenobacter chitinivorans DSM 11115]
MSNPETDSTTSPYGRGTLPKRVRSRMVHGVNGLDVHLLEAGYESPGRPLALLLHGFPDLAYGWRHLLPLLADAGYHVVAPDQRGFGRTTGWANQYDTPLAPFGLLNMTRDALSLVSALGYRQTAMLVGHDFGSPVAAYCALARPDVFPSVVLMSAPFPGPPALPFNTAASEASPVQPSTENQQLAAALAALTPPRISYQQYLSTRQANEDLWHPPQGLHAFLRAFFYVKSADWPGNKPHPLQARTALELAQLPTYYVMERGQTMPQTVAPFYPSAAEVGASPWLTEPELAVYTEEYDRTGFQGALQAYRVYADADLNAELRLFSGRTLDVPSLFIGGQRDWATYAAPGALELMTTKATTRMGDIELIEGAGHWIQQEQPARLSALLLAFSQEAGGRQ